MRHNDGSYKEVDIYEEKGFDDYSELSEHQSIRDVLSQFAMIDPYKIFETFKVLNRPTSTIDSNNSSQKS